MEEAATSDIEENKALVRAFYEGDFISGDASKVEAYFAPDFVDHDPPGPLPAKGPEGVRAVMGLLADALPQRRIEVHDTIAEGDKVVLRFSLHGEHEGMFMGRGGTGTDVELKIIAILRLEARR